MLRVSVLQTIKGNYRNMFAGGGGGWQIFRVVECGSSGYWDLVNFWVFLMKIKKKGFYGKLTILPGFIYRVSQNGDSSFETCIFDNTFLINYEEK